ncbi:MAG: Penicillin-binding protein, 1A family [Candidatus Magasanikbacteria bacterium GW2011_GWC2_45_8]|uniref:Penicillin-binding protein, 1A family n=1 Tax=Candidatus Magasanikbacteria bacterium GW2011_GWC2_45_8 TaxID=1619050 RepID=A0A0G1N094_9BACT|nr:MAG: Penicillin-binding protein, 1A family [Candidatus Magasanikbacteria bacterium GW2011_GWC2_45_8]
MNTSRFIRSPRDWHTKPNSTSERTSHNRKKQLIRRGLTIAGTALLLIWIIGTFTIAWSSRTLPDPNKLIDRTVAESTKIYDQEGKTLLYEIYRDKKRTLVEINTLPDYIKNATVSVEDKDFYLHKGIAWKSILRAGFSNIFGLSAGKGGASTITQQLVKNAILTSEHSFSRKIKEALLALQLERKYSKDQILQLYLNEIPYGGANYGIEAASENFFGKSAKDLTLAEAATLASLPQAPSKYINNRSALLQRRNYVLQKMADYGYITKDQTESAQKTELGIKTVGGAGTIAPHFVLYIKDQLIEKYGEQMVESGGLKVITSLDVEKQQIAEEAVKAQAEKNEKKYGARNAALIAMDPKNGHILAMIGSKDFFDEKIDGQVNVALRLRQPGSSFKPIVYAAAFEKGYTPDTKLFDVQTIFKTETKDFSPRNYDNKERGVVTMRQALAGSLNIPAVKTLYLTGVDRVLDFAQKLGYTSLNDRSRFGLALVLGGGEVKLLEHVSAYMVFAREGTKIPTVSILKVTDSKGNVLDEWKENPSVEVVAPQVVRELTSIMTDDSARAFIFGAGSALTLKDRLVAAKTGTTNDWRDGWTMGFTPSLVAGVWAGNNDNTPMKKGSDGVLVAAPIWNKFMSESLKNTPPEPFTPPDPYPADIKPILRGDGFGLARVAINSTNSKLATDTTPPDLITYKTFAQNHSLLYFINKDDPNGPPLSDPTKDPQYLTWEEGVRNWAEKNNIIEEKSPSEKDSSENIDTASLQIITPSQNQTINTSEFSVKIINSNSSIDNLVFYLDDNRLEKQESAQNEFKIKLPTIDAGFHTLIIRGFKQGIVTAITKIDINTLPPPQFSTSTP